MIMKSKAHARGEYLPRDVQGEHDDAEGKEVADPGAGLIHEEQGFLHVCHS
jgi:hypothetical protein